MSKTLEQFVSESDSRETSPEILKAIATIARDYDEAVRIWEEPTEEELERIYNLVTEDERYHPTEFVWGAVGTHWADSIWK